MKDGITQLDIGAATQPRTLFKPGSWIAKIDFINHLILFNNVLITVLSEKEGGKTCFSSLLQNNLDQQIKSVFMTVTPPCDRQSIINDISAQLHLNNDASTDIGSIVAQINERKAHVLLIIDNAQHLPESLIKEAMIAIKNQDNFGFFHLCLVSDYSVVATLNNLAVEQFNNLIHTIELGALNESETRTYVLQRAMATRLITRPLSDAQFKQFYQLTKGNLAKINSDLEAFIFKCSAPKQSTQWMTLKRTSAALSAVVIAAVSYLYFDGLNFSHQPSELVNAPNTNNVATIQSEEQLASNIASWQDSSTRQLVSFALPKKQILDDIDDDQSSNTVALVDKVVVIPTVKASVPITQHLVDVVKPMAESTLVSISGFKDTKSVKKIIAKVSVNKFTIQLVASHKISDIHRLKQNNKLFSNSIVRQFTNAKGNWYVLTLGEFSSRNQAQTHIHKLSSGYAQFNPWIRPISGLSKIG